jgi:hypothetical protein
MDRPQADASWPSGRARSAKDLRSATTPIKPRQFWLITATRSTIRRKPYDYIDFGQTQHRAGFQRQAMQIRGNLYSWPLGGEVPSQSVLAVAAPST